MFKLSKLRITDMIIDIKIREFDPSAILGLSIFVKYNTSTDEILSAEKLE